MKVWQNYFSGIAALICAVSVAMSAYTSHGLQGQAQSRLFMATAFAFAHGIALIVLSRGTSGRSNFAACSMMLFATNLFSASLASAALWNTPTTLAPLGGILLILSWCWVAVNFFKGRLDSQ